MSSTTDNSGPGGTVPYFEIHGETHGSVGGSYDLDEAKELVETLDEAFEQEHHVIKTERVA